MRVGGGLELARDLGTDQHLAAEQLLQLGDLGLERVALGLELDARELREPAQAQLEDVLGLDLAEVEHLAQPRARLLAVVRACG